MRTVPYPMPGEILVEGFLKPMALSQYRLAKEIGVPPRRIGEIVAGKRAVTADTGLRLAKFFGTSEGFWTGLQDDYGRVMTKDAIAPVLRVIVTFSKRAAWWRYLEKLPSTGPADRICEYPTVGAKPQRAPRSRKGPRATGPAG